MTLVTKTVEDVGGAPDNSAWVFYSSIRESSSGDSIVTSKRVRRNPVNGELSVELDPGPVTAVDPHGSVYAITVPDTETADLWDLIGTSVLLPPDTAWEKISSAVLAYFQAADPEEARNAISAVADYDFRLDDNRVPIDGSVTLGKLNSALVAILATLSGAQTLTNKTLTSPVVDVVKDANGNTLLNFLPVASAVNYLQIANDAAGSPPQLRALGADANIGIFTRPKGTGALVVYVATGQTPTIQANGADANHNLNLVSKGTGVVQVNGSPVGVKVSVPASASATGVVGQWAADSSWHYTCIAANTWVRSAAATW